MTTKKNRNGKRGRGGGPSKNPDGSFKSRLQAKQKELLKAKLKSRIDQVEAPVTRSAAGSSSRIIATAAFTLTTAIINILVTEINSAPCLYCQAGAVCSHQRKNLCFPQDVTVAFTSITETEETTRSNKAQKAADKIERQRNLRVRKAEAERTEKVARKVARVKLLLAGALLKEVNDWITKVITYMQLMPTKFCCL